MITTHSRRACARASFLLIQYMYSMYAQTFSVLTNTKKPFWAVLKHIRRIICILSSSSTSKLAFDISVFHLENYLVFDGKCFILYIDVDEEGEIKPPVNPEIYTSITEINNTFTLSTRITAIFPFRKLCRHRNMECAKDQVNKFHLLEKKSSRMI